MVIISYCELSTAVIRKRVGSWKRLVGSALVGRRLVAINHKIVVTTSERGFGFLNTV